MNLFNLHEKFDVDDSLLFSKFVDVAASLGFEYCAYGVRTVCPHSVPAVINNYHDDWNLTYQENDYFSVDPVVRHGLMSTRALIWNEDSFSQLPEFREQAKSFGLVSGLSQSQRDEYKIGMFTMASAYKEYNVSAFTPHFLWLSHFAHEKLSNFLMPEDERKLMSKLTRREIDVLSWVSEGKNTSSVADLLCISESTVNFHINNIIKKLGVANKHSAIAKAMAHNLLL